MSRIKEMFSRKKTTELVEELPEETREELPEEAPGDSEKIEAERRKQSQETGAHVLAAVSFQNRHPIVESSFDLARSKGEKLVGKNNERRNLAYLKRLERLIGEKGNRLEKHLWQASIGGLITEPENFSDGYWAIQEQILRDNGNGHALGDVEKNTIIEKVQRKQRESLQTWASYLGDESTPFPMWFKVYAWDGMSKMGIYDKNKKQFTKRDEHTVAPYPGLNAAALAKVYAAICEFYGIDEDKSHKENTTSDAELSALVKAGNFNKLYSRMLLSEKTIVKTPERTEDVRGEWVEYRLGQENALAWAAEGTPWCIAEPCTGKEYLMCRAGLEDYKHGKNKAKFLLFHLTDADTGKISDTACASIRLDRDGNVAEISGLNEGQALEDSLVPIVEEKVKTLPGGESFLEAFADKERLIAMDKKMQNNEDLTLEELGFLYELERPIRTLDTYRNRDPRIGELREKYGLEYASRAGMDVKRAVEKFEMQDIISNLDYIIQSGVEDIDWVISKLEPIDIVRNYEKIASYKTDIDIVAAVREMNREEVFSELEMLFEYGVEMRDLLPMLANWQVADKAIWLVEHGADVDVVVARIKTNLPGAIVCNMKFFGEHGVDVEGIVGEFSPSSIAAFLDEIVEYGIRIDVERLARKLSPEDLMNYYDSLTKHGAKLDFDKVISKLKPDDFIRFANKILKRRPDYDIGRALKKADPVNILYHLEDLGESGIRVNIDELTKRIKASEIGAELYTLLKYDANVGLIARKLGPKGVIENIEVFIKSGVKVDQLVPYLSQRAIRKHRNLLREYGAEA